MLNNVPLIVIHPVLLEIHLLFACNLDDGGAILVSESEHVVSRVPAGGYIAGHNPVIEPKIAEDRVPL